MTEELLQSRRRHHRHESKNWRRGRDSNPRYRFVPIHRISNAALSAAQPPLRVGPDRLVLSPSVFTPEPTLQTQEPLDIQGDAGGRIMPRNKNCRKRRFLRFPPNRVHPTDRFLLGEPSLGAPMEIDHCAQALPPDPPGVSLMGQPRARNTKRAIPTITSLML